MHGNVRRANFTTKPHLQGKYSALALFVHGYSFQSCCLGNSFTQTSQLYNFNTRLGGEICSSDIAMHKGHLMQYTGANQFLAGFSSVLS